MAILVVEDFNTLKEVKIKIISIPEFIADPIVSVYWHDLAKKVNVAVDDLPVEPNTKVKDYLVYKVATEVAIKSQASNLQQISEGIVVDQWKMRTTTWTNHLINLRADIATEDVIDPANEIESSKNTMLTTWKAG